MDFREKCHENANFIDMPVDRTLLRADVDGIQVP